MGIKHHNERFQSIIEQATSQQGRRHFLKGGLGLSLLAVLPETLKSAFAVPAAGNAQPSLGFDAVQKSLLDDVLLPEGYKYTILHATGDPMRSSIAAYRTASKSPTASLVPNSRITASY